MNEINVMLGGGGSDLPVGWPPPCPHCGDDLLTSEERGLHCDGCDDLTAEDEREILEKFSGPNAAGSASEYVIATVGDFLKVPEDRQADCLAEFADFLGVARGIVELASIAGEVVGGDASAQIGPFTWIDDGKRNRTIRIHVKNDGADRP